MTPLCAWILTAMLAWTPPNPSNVRQLAAYVALADAITSATQDPADAIQLASIAWWETGGTFHLHAVGALGEIGPFQLLPPNAPRELRAQAVEALRRLHILTLAGYTGERANPRGTHPLARHRARTAMDWLASHPPPSDQGQASLAP